MIAFIVRPLVEWFFPRSLERAAGALGTLSIVMAVLVGAFFPVSAHAGTETMTARWITTAALAVAGGGLFWSRGSFALVGASIAVLVAGALVAPAGWLVLAAGGCCIYAGASLVRRSTEDPATADDEPPATDVQEMMESIALALCLALVVREFEFEAFKIPTGSMEPTILGDGQNRQGDRLLAFKGAEIRRWDIAVFRFPLFRNTNYIKRTIGLPGERVEIRNGDIYVNGKIAPKPDSVQEVMWQRIAPPRDDEEWISRFEPDPANAWVLRKGFAEVNATGDGVAWLEADASYQDADLRVSFDVDLGDAPAAGQLLVRLDGGRRRVELVLDSAFVKVSMPGAEWSPEISTFPGFGAKPEPASSAGDGGPAASTSSIADFGSKFRLGLSMSDRIVRIWRNGRQVAWAQHPDVTNDGLDQGKVRIGAKHLKATIRNFLVEHDVQYGMTGTTSWTVPGDSYVMLGDNTGSSKDSRYWVANVIRTRDGREFVAPDDARIAEDKPPVVTFVQRPDGGVRFVDSYGVQHEFTKDEIEPVRRNVSVPFVKHDDLVGRAFFIFYPFPPVGDFRPRFLR